MTEEEENLRKQKKYENLPVEQKELLAKQLKPMQKQEKVIPELSEEDKKFHQNLAERRQAQAQAYSESESESESEKPERTKKPEPIKKIYKESTNPIKLVQITPELLVTKKLKPVGDITQIIKPPKKPLHVTQLEERIKKIVQRSKQSSSQSESEEWQ